MTAEEIDALFQGYDGLSRKREQPAALAAAWYARGLSDQELAERARALIVGIEDRLAEITVRELLRQLGERA